MPIYTLRDKLDQLLPRQHQLILVGLTSLLLVAALLPETEQAPVSAPKQDSAIPEQLAVETRPVIGVSSEPEALDELQATQPEHPATSLATAIETKDTRLFLKVKSGDNLSVIFKRAGLGPREVFQIANSGDEAKVLNNLYPGYSLAFEIDSQQILQSLELIKNPLESTLFTRDSENHYSTQQINKEPTIAVVYKEAIISDSLFMAAQRGGIPAGLTMELSGIFGGVIDFILDTREGDEFNILYEEKYVDGEFVGNGRILAAQFTNQGEQHTALRYENSEGDSNFYNPEGESMRKAFLRNPVDFTRISSNFNLSRKHPILNTIRAHKGTDYAAPRGTPVVATADGRVSFANRKGSFGKLVVIQHGERFETKYAHLNDYANGIKSGAKVKQGQVIGYVGSTGGATGPHLHFEFLMDGVHRNARTIHDKLPKAESIAKSEMARFIQQTAQLTAQLHSHQAPVQLATNTATSTANNSSKNQ